MFELDYLYNFEQNLLNVVKQCLLGVRCYCHPNWEQVWLPTKNPQQEYQVCWHSFLKEDLGRDMDSHQAVHPPLPTSLSLSFACNSALDAQGFKV